MKQLTTVLLLIPFLASAHPESATNYLINEPASLMDIGLLRMRLDLTDGEVKQLTRFIVDRALLDEDKEGSWSLSLLTQYDYADDMIIVKLFIFGKSDDAEKDCKFAVQSLASAVALDMEEWFSHSGFKRGNPPSLENLKSRTSIVCEAEFPGLKRVEVTRKLDQKTSSVRKY